MEILQRDLPDGTPPDGVTHYGFIQKSDTAILFCKDPYCIHIGDFLDSGETVHIAIVIFQVEFQNFAGAGTRFAQTKRFREKVTDDGRLL